MINMKCQSLFLLSLFGTAAAFQLTPTIKHHNSRHSSMVPLQMSIDLVDPSYNLAIGALGVGLVGGVLEDIKDKSGEKLITAKLFGGVALVFTIFSAFLAFQTTTLRFGFDDDSFYLVKNDESSFENVVVGGENKWKYSSFQNWDFLPSEKFPILVYFKEDQTPLENREEAPSFLLPDTLLGQAHFFPAISDSEMLKAGFTEHDCAKQ
jgi:hypothetical protein